VFRYKLTVLDEASLHILAETRCMQAHKADAVCRIVDSFGLMFIDFRKLSAEKNEKLM